MSAVSSSPTTQPFLDWLRGFAAAGEAANDEVLALVLPLFAQVRALHAEGLVAPLAPGALGFDPATRALVLDRSAAAPAQERRGLVETAQATLSRGVDIVGHSRYETDLDAGTRREVSLAVGEGGGASERPLFLPDYRSWELALGHHDELTDLFLLGQVLASVACGLDFTQPDDLAEFVRHRGNLFALRPRLHPVIAAVITELTELNRHQRAPDLGAVIVRLENYREQPDDFDLRAIPGLAQAAPDQRRTLILGRLRDRLFEISRRNRLIYFKPSQTTVNLTVSSVPTALDYRSIRAEQLCFWHPTLAGVLGEGNALPLGRYLRFEDHPYVAPALDKLISEARRDRAEYGFQQLRLVIAFLRWHNLREAPQELIESPLLLLPVELAKKKGVRDSYVVEPVGTRAVINPALRFHLAQLYRLQLPEFIDLRETTAEELCAQLRAQIQASEPGVTLQLIDKPQIRLVQVRARQRVEAYRRRQELRGKPLAAGRVSYSYARDDFRPLGLTLFRERVLPRAFDLRLAAGAKVDPPPPAYLADPAPGGPTVLETQAETYVFGGDHEKKRNPYAWEFDLCSVTLGNFNTRKMSLVQDYASLLAGAPACPAFDTLFSLAPKPPPPAIPPLALARQHFVVPSDAAQAAAVAQAQLGGSFIIQGPPGTGKSQTITNLVADFVARGKRVLFVCEKRAAIDVVFHRLRQQGLDELCCLIHDSQTDKKDFIQNLKQTSETFLVPAEALAAGARKRGETVQRLEQELESLRRFSEQLTTARKALGMSPRDLLERLLALRAAAGEAALNAEDEEQLSDYAHWPRHGAAARRLAQALADLGEDPVFGRHPLRWLGAGLLESDRPTSQLKAQLDEAEDALESVENALGLAGEGSWNGQRLAVLAELLALAEQAQMLANHGLLGVLAGRGEAVEAVKKFQRDYAAKLKAQAKAAEKSAGWSDPPGAEETAIWLDCAKATEASALRFFQPAWWKMRGEVLRRYDFSRHKVAPSYSRVLGELAATHAAEIALRTLREEQAEAWKCGDPLQLSTDARELQEKAAAGIPAVRALAQRLGEEDGLAAALAGARPEFLRLQRALAFLELPASATLRELGEILAAVRGAADVLPELLPALRELAAAEPSFANAVRFLPHPVDTLEFASARRSLAACWREDRQAARLDGPQLEARIERFSRLQRDLLEMNAAAIRHGVRAKFLEHVRLSGLPAAQLDLAQKEFKKTYSTGRRELEHEFGKTMRHRSIRDLAAGAPGAVLRDLKPVWLMSPLSVSDTLPLEPELFDVVIFDEASQVPLEEAIPAIYRAPQVIVVGDEMQLPPTSFFASGQADDDELTVADEAGEKVALSLDADSFLTQSAIALPSTLLAWHYRSRSEALISFSNAAFYGAKLLTIPDRTLPPEARPPLDVRSADDAARHADQLLARSISFHHLAHSPYEQRRNLGEAVYLARLVRELLRRGTGLSIGVVAFSEAQQGAIEAAIERLAEEDADFATRYEAEVSREEDDQFCGLFIKNLENVQGDERDIILLSICYGRDATGRMLMNFGPINQRGGEKRLNVIFSRAKRHMAVVSSIRHPEITNDWNDGASALKNFLRYAEHVSRGEHALAGTVLGSLNALQRESRAGGAESSLAVAQLAAALRSRGHQVDLAAGQSRFRCDLAMRDPLGDSYALAVQLDTPAHYANPDLQERYFTRPGLLRAFGWKVLHVLAKDWFEDPERVLARIERALLPPEKEAEAGAEPEVEDETMPAPPELPGQSRPEPEPAPTSAPAAAAAPPEAEAAPPAVEYRAYLEFIGGNSRKFWEASVRGASLVVRFGRLGTKGQEQTKAFASAAAAEAKARALVAEKVAGGYRAT